MGIATGGPSDVQADDANAGAPAAERPSVGYAVLQRSHTIAPAPTIGGSLLPIDAGADVRTLTVAAIAEQLQASA